MKKPKLLILLIALCPLMSGCQDTEHSVISINSYNSENPLVELSIFTLRNLLDEKQDFVLEMYSPTCSACEEFEPIITKYAAKQNHVIYRLNVRNIAEENYRDYLEEPYPDIFSESFIPSVSFISEGKLTYKVSSQKFTSYTGFKSVMNKHFTSSKITMINTLEEFTEYKNNIDSYVCYFYDLGSQYSVRYASQYIINSTVAKKKTPVLLINTNALGRSYVNDIKEYYKTDISCYACIVKNKEIKRTIDYSFDDGSGLEELISAF